MADSVVVVVDSRCWALVARATAAMALRPHQGNCCYPPAPFPPPPVHWLCDLIGWDLSKSLKVTGWANLYYGAIPYVPSTPICGTSLSPYHCNVRESLKSWIFFLGAQDNYKKQCDIYFKKNIYLSIRLRCHQISNQVSFCGTAGSVRGTKAFGRWHQLPVHFRLCTWACHSIWS